MTVVTDNSSGYVHNLTPAQEAKLRDLWVFFFTSAASILTSVYDVKLPEGPPSKLFEVLDKITEPTVEAVISALKDAETNEHTDASATDRIEISGGDGDNVEKKDSGIGGEHREQETLDKVESLINKDEAKKTLRTEMTTKTVTPEHFSALFAQLRKMGMQESEIKTMEKVVARMSPEDMCFAVIKMIKQEHPDSLLLRFLRARKWDVRKAFTMAVSAILWRKEMEVDDDITPKGELHALQKSRDPKLSAAERKEGADFLEQLRTGKSFLHGVDRQGRPVIYVRVKIHKPGAQSQEALERYIVHVIESTRMIIAPPVEAGTIVFDMSGFSLSNMEYQPVKFILKCFEANYPESLGLLLIHNAPWIFSGVWRLIHGWMDPVVASKVQFTRSIEDIDRFVPREQVPRELAGDEDWEYKYKEPEDDENAIMQDTETRDSLMLERLMSGIRMFAATAAWISATTFAGGKRNQATVEAVKTRRDTTIQEFRENYWRLDPYVRARSLIDRAGMLNPGGAVAMGPEGKGG